MSSLPTSLTGAATPGAQESGAATPGAGTQPLSAPAPAAAPQAAPPTGAASGPAPGLQSVPSPTFSPLYQQIKALITRSLQSGEWKPGEMIPSEMELASRYKVSQGTVRKAIDELAAENLVARRQGKGTFVTTHHEDVVKFRFLRLVPDEGEPHYGASHVLECKRLRAPAEIARLLDIRTGDSVVQIRRVLTFSGESTVLDEIWLLGANFKGLTAEKLTEWKGPMYALFEAEFDTRMIRASEKIRAVPADETAAELLSVPVGAPLLSVERVSYTYGDRPVEVRRGLYVTTRHYYQNDLS
ncbi:GntR family transcriptional regulator [Cupriavidus taiwanensis]|uniref:GntR family transcriptional regulator n=1 Tax=Cupriavidus taiwanensis TaxID=164546 RepID=UPI000E2ED1B7|nr:GntR family transcriptional regulator [Cupriavidus taiwanensis]